MNVNAELEKMLKWTYCSSIELENLKKTNTRPQQKQPVSKLVSNPGPFE